MKEYEILLYSLDSLNINYKFKNSILQALDRIQKLDFYEITEVYLFGSLSKNSESALSDIDLLVVTEETIFDRYKRSEITCLMDDTKNINFDIIVYSKEQLATGSSVFIHDINSNKILLMKEVNNKCEKFTNTRKKVHITR